jgi:hypothetical protein
MSEEIRLGDWEQRDSDGYVRIHGYELGQLIKQANGAYNMMVDLNKLAVRSRRWRKIADDLFVMLSAYVATEESDAMKNFVQAVADEQG